MFKEVPQKLLEVGRVLGKVLLHDLVLRRLLPVQLLLGVHVLLHAAGGELAAGDAPVLEVRHEGEGAGVGADVEAACVRLRHVPAM